MCFIKKQEQEYQSSKIKAIEKYITQVKNPSKAFQDFLNDYFIGPAMIRGRSEEDISVWNKMNEEELSIAKQMVLENLGHDPAYIRAVGIFRDERAIPILEKLVDNLPENFCYEKLLAAKILYDWIDYKKYLSILADILPKSGNYTKTNLYSWINVLDKKTAAHYIFMMLEDPDDFVRWCAYGVFLDYFKLGKSGFHQSFEETKFYTADEVYANKALFQERINILKNKVNYRINL